MTLFLLLLAWSFAGLKAQNCFQSFFDKGVNAYESLDFDTALKQFKAAKVCSEITSEQETLAQEWIDKTSNAYIRKLKSGLLTVQSILSLERNGDATRGLRFAQHAIELEDTPDTRQALYNSYYAQVGFPAQKYYRTLGRMEHTGVRDLEVSPDGKYILALDHGTSKVWTDDGELVKEYNSDKWEVNSIGFTPDSKSILMACSDGFLRSENISWQKSKKIPMGEGAGIHLAEWSPDGTYYVAVNKEGLMRIADGNDETIKEVEVPKYLSYAIKFKGDGAYFILHLISFESKILLYKSDGTLVMDLNEKFGEVTDAALAPIGNQLVVADSEGEVSVLSLEGSELKALVRHGSLVSQTHFGPNGNYFMTVGSDRVIRVWLADGTPVGNLSHSSSIFGSTFFV